MMEEEEEQQGTHSQHSKQQQRSRKKTTTTSGKGFGGIDETPPRSGGVSVRGVASLQARAGAIRIF